MAQRVIHTENREQKKHLLVWTVLLLFLLLVIAAVNLRFTEITVLGNKSYTDEEVIALVMPEQRDRNPLYSLLKTAFRKEEELPFVSSYQIRPTGLTSCEIILYEKNPVGYVSYMSGYMYFDRDGTIIESSSVRREDIPEITGLRFGKIVLNRKLEVEGAGLYEEILNITQQLSVSGITCSQISFDTLGNAVLTIDGGSIRVKLGGEDYLEAKLKVLGDVIGEMRARGLRGTADLSSYQDTVSDSFTFLPDPETGAEEAEESGTGAEEN